MLSATRYVLLVWNAESSIAFDGAFLETPLYTGHAYSCQTHVGGKTILLTSSSISMYPCITKDSNATHSR